DVNYHSRSAMATTLGADANPDSGSPNLDVGDDRIFVPYMQAVGANAGRTRLFEYIGSLTPYGFVQAERPIGQLTSATATYNDGVAVVTVNIPLTRMRVGTVKDTATPVNQVPTAPGFVANDVSIPDDTVYLQSQSWFDPTYPR